MTRTFTVLLAHTGLVFLLSLSSAPLPATHAQPLLARPNVVFVIVDTSRADRFFGPRTAAHLSRLPGFAFTDVWAQAPSTSSAVATMFTGLLPSAHGVYDGGGTLPRHLPTLAEHFRNAGYLTAHITGNPNSGPLYEVDRGFQQVHWSSEGPGSELLHHQLQHADAIGTLALEFLAKASSPFLLSLHFNDPHSPYDPIDAPVRRAPRQILDEPSSDPGVGAVTPLERADMLARYDREIASVDATLARIVQALRKSGAWDRTLLVVTADHGEEFQDHGGWGHSHTLYPEVLRIPLFIRRPADTVRRVVRGRVNQTDILPTVLELAGLPPPGRITGRSRAALMAGGKEETPVTVAEKLSSDKGEPRQLLLTDAWAFIDHKVSGRAELYDARRDPSQLKNLAGAHPDVVQRLRRELKALLGGTGATSSAKPVRIDPDTLRNLQALGYLQGHRSSAPGSGSDQGSAEMIVRRILTNLGAGDIWKPEARATSVAADDSPRTFDVRIALPPISVEGGRTGRLRFASSAHATTLSDVRVEAAEGSGQRSVARHSVLFGGEASRRLPPGAVVESDPVLLPPGARWIVSFTSAPVALVRLTGVEAGTEVRPSDAREPGGWIAQPHSTLGLVGIVLDSVPSRSKKPRG